MASPAFTPLPLGTLLIHVWAACKSCRRGSCPHRCVTAKYFYKEAVSWLFFMAGSNILFIITWFALTVPRTLPDPGIFLKV